MRVKGKCKSEGEDGDDFHYRNVLMLASQSFSICTIFNVRHLDFRHFSLRYFSFRACARESFSIGKVTSITTTTTATTTTQTTTTQTTTTQTTTTQTTTTQTTTTTARPSNILDIRPDIGRNLSRGAMLEIVLL